MLQRLVFTLSFLLLLTFTYQTFAAEQSQFRKTFLAAEKQLWQAQNSKYQSLYKQLHYYPLQPYLDQQRLMHNISLAKGDEIIKFLIKYQGTPLDWPLRKKWLKYLAKKNKQSLFINAYRPTSNVELSCQYHQFKVNSGVNKQAVLPKVTKLWTAGKSQPKVCDPLFKIWQQAGYRTESVIWQRIKLSADGGDHTLLRYLGSLLPPEQKYLADLWKQVRRNPAYIAKLSRFPKKSAQETEIMLYGLKRLIWRDPDLALKVFPQAANSFNFSSQQQNKLTATFALALASKSHQAAEVWLHKVDDNFIDKDISQWRIANALRANNWPDIQAELLLFPLANQEKMQWKYWYGRSLVETGKVTEGIEQLKKIANNRHYYGFLAASQIQQNMNYQHDPLKITEQEKIEVLKFPEAKRAFELFHIGRFNQARKEWNYWLTKLDDRQKLVASRIAYEHKWYDRAIFALSSVGYLNDVELRFPLAYNKDINHYAKSYKISPAWAFAIARRESSFMSDAHSPVGARGLMQIMPKTAKQLKGVQVPKQYLLKARNNIELGTKYLKELLERYKGNNVLATASYNAGPYRVSKWLESTPALPADMWIETIPYRETREYVKSVLAYQQIYQVKVGQEETIFDQLIQLQIHNSKAK